MDRYIAKHFWCFITYGRVFLWKIPQCTGLWEFFHLKHRTVDSTIYRPGGTFEDGKDLSQPFFSKMVASLDTFFLVKTMYCNSFCWFFMTLISVNLLFPTKFSIVPLGLIYKKRPWGIRRGNFLLMRSIKSHCGAALLHNQLVPVGPSWNCYYYLTSGPPEALTNNVSCIKVQQQCTIF